MIGVKPRGRLVRRFAWLGLAVAALGLMAVLSLWLVPEWLGRAYGGSDRVMAVDNARTAAVAFLVIIGSAATILYTARTYNLTREGQITERYSRAVEHLGDHEKLDVRLGGIYALERIARDSKRDQAAIIEILAAFVRGHSKRGDSNSLPAPGTRLAVDVQAALTVLGRLPDRVDMPRVDLSFCNLDFADLSGAHLPRVVLRYSLLRSADLSHAILTDADLTHADLTYSTLTGCNLKEAQLHEAILDRVKATAVILDNAKLSNAGLYMAELAHASLRNAEMRSSKLRGPDSSEVFLGAGRAHFVAEQLNGTDLTGAKLPYLLRDLSLRNVVGLTQDQLDQVSTMRVSLPDGLSARSAVAAKETHESSAEHRPADADPP